MVQLLFSFILKTCIIGKRKNWQYSRENGAMVEVFYEALNFEVFTESEAYGVRTLEVYKSLN